MKSLSYKVTIFYLPCLTKFSLIHVFLLPLLLPCLDKDSTFSHSLGFLCHKNLSFPFLVPSSYHKNYTIHVLFSSSWKDSALYSVSCSLPNKSLQCKRFPTTTCLALIFMYKCSLCVISTWIVENHVSYYSHSTYLCKFIGARCMSFPSPI